MINAQQIEENLPELALQCVLQNQIDEVDGSAIYSAHETWQKAELQKHPRVTVVQDAATLEDAVANPEQLIIYIPHLAHITQAITRAILARNPLKKYILWESAHG